MRPQIVNPGKPLSESALSAVEKQFYFRFPDSYRAFLLEHNGGEPRPSSFRGRGSKTPNEVCREFIGVNTGRGSDHDLKSALENCKDPANPRLPDRFIPIAEDPFGNLICISVSGKDAGKIYFWDHEEELGQRRKKTGGLDDSAITLLAASFDKFLNQFDRAPEEEPAARLEQIILNEDLPAFRKWLAQAPAAQGPTETIQAALHFSAHHGKREFLDELLRHGAPIHEAFTAAINDSAWDIVKWLLAKPEAAQLTITPYDFQQALDFCSDVDLIRTLLNAGASVDADLQRGKPLHHAADGPADPAILKLLIERGAQIGQPSRTGRLAVTFAICKRQLDSAKLLMDAGENLYYEPPASFSAKDRQLLAEYEDLQKQGKVSAEFITMQRTRMEFNRVKSPIFYLDLHKDRAFKTAILAHAQELGQTAP